MSWEPVGVAEIAAMLGVTRSAVHKIANTDDSFPEPRAQLSAGKIWARSDIEAWLRGVRASDHPKVTRNRRDRATGESR